MLVSRPIHILIRRMISLLWGLCYTLIHSLKGASQERRGDQDLGVTLTSFWLVTSDMSVLVRKWNKLRTVCIILLGGNCRSNIQSNILDQAQPQPLMRNGQATSIYKHISTLFTWVTILSYLDTYHEIEGLMSCCVSIARQKNSFNASIVQFTPCRGSVR